MRHWLCMSLSVAFLTGCGRSNDQAVAPPAVAESKEVVKPVKPATRQRSAYEERIAAFRQAVEKGRVSEVKELLKSADINDKDDNGQTPLMWAASHGQTSIFLLLWNQGALANERDSQGRTALMLAAAGNHTQILGLLLTPETALATAGEAIKAAGLVGEDKLKLLGIGSSLNETDRKGQTALMLACAAGAREAVDFLLGQYADVTLRDGQGKTALMYAAEGGRPEVAEQLLGQFKEVKPGLDYVGMKNADGKTAAELARAAKHDRVREVIEEYARDPNAQDEKGLTPLMRAIAAKDRAAIDRLFRRGVNTSLQDGEGKTAAMHAAIHGVSDMLSKKGYAAFANPDQRDVLYIVDKKGMTALMYAAANNNSACVSFLVGRLNVGTVPGSFPDFVVTLTTAADKEGRNALMHAAATGHASPVEAILRSYGQEAGAFQPGPVALQELLKRTDKAGKTALMIADEAKHTKVVDLLKEYGAK